MSDIAKNARLAGGLYLGIIVLGIGSEVALRGPLINWADGRATAEAISANLALFRLSIVADLLMAVLDVTLALVFFGMLRAVHGPLSLAAMVFRLMQAAIIAGNVMMLFAAQQSLSDDPVPWLERHAAGYDLGLLFFAINTLIMARLLGRIAPRWLCWALAAAGLVYAFGSITRFAAPEINALMQPAYLVPIVAEVSLMLWLLIRAPRLS